MRESIVSAFNRLTQTELVFVLIFGGIFLFRLFYLFFFTGKAVTNIKRRTAENTATPLSLLFTVRNEEQNLQNNLPQILDIQRAGFDAVVVDDFSDDNSLTVLGVLHEKYSNLKVSSLSQETRYSVKLAQNVAIKGAKKDWVMVVPVSVSEFAENWLDEVSATINANLQVVVNYSNLKKAKGIFNLFYRIERFFQQLTSYGFILNRLPFVYFEENVAFRKEDYFKTGGYGQKIKEPFANLELLINTFIRKKTTALNLCENAAIRKEEAVKKADYLDLLKKQIRIENHLSKFKRSVLWVVRYSGLVFFLLGIFIIFFISTIWFVVAAAFGVYAITFSFIIKIALNRLKERNLFLPSLLYGMLVPYFKLIYRWYFKRRSRKQRWKSKN